MKIRYYKRTFIDFEYAPLIKVLEKIYKVTPDNKLWSYEKNKWIESQNSYNLPDDIYYVKETSKSGKVTYFMFKGDLYYIYTSKKEWSLRKSVSEFIWSDTNRNRNYNWKDEFIMKRELFYELL